MLELSDPQGFILGEVADKRMKRKDVALSYALCIKSTQQVDFAAINAAIINRWSVSGLVFIKERAWKIINGKVNP